MAEFIEILRPETNPTFTVDTSVNEVNVNAYPQVNGVLVDHTGGGTELIPEDNFIILQYGISFPYCFTPATPGMLFWLSRYQGGALYPVLEINQRLPNQVWNTEIELGTFVPFRDDRIAAIDYALNYELLVSDFQGTISMIGVPDSLHGQELEFEPWVKIKHNRAMS